LRQQLFHPVDRAVVTLVDLKMQKELVGMGGVFPDVPMQHPAMFDDPAGMKNHFFYCIKLGVHPSTYPQVNARKNHLIPKEKTHKKHIYN
jgi:hypothetical protein